jgi:hypothetical protein
MGLGIGSPNLLDPSSTLDSALLYPHPHPKFNQLELQPNNNNNNNPNDAFLPYSTNAHAPVPPPSDGTRTGMTKTDRERISVSGSPGPCPETQLPTIMQPDPQGMRYSGPLSSEPEQMRKHAWEQVVIGKVQALYTCMSFPSSSSVGLID